MRENVSIVNEGKEGRNKKQAIFTSSNVTWSSYFIFLKEYTFEHVYNMRIYQFMFTMKKNFMK